MSTENAPLNEASVSPPAPRTRWAAIVWGLFFALLAAGSLWLMASDPEALRDWAAALTVEALVACAVLALGVLVLVAGTAGLLRRAQRRVNG